MNLENLPDNELKVGIKKSINNARELFQEGDILFNANRYSRAYCLYQLSAEEVGKSRLLFALLMDRQLGKNINYKEVNKEFSHHQTKSRSAVTFEMIALLMMFSNQNDKPAQERRRLFLDSLQRVESENDANILNNNKNNSLYVGVKDKKFFDPKNIVNKEMAAELRTDVSIRLEAGKSILEGMLDDLDNIVNLIRQAEQTDTEEISEKFLDTFFKD